LSDVVLHRNFDIEFELLVVYYSLGDGEQDSRLSRNFRSEFLMEYICEQNNDRHDIWAIDVVASSVFQQFLPCVHGNISAVSLSALLDVGDYIRDYIFCGDSCEFYTTRGNVRVTLPNESLDTYGFSNEFFVYVLDDIYGHAVSLVLYVFHDIFVDSLATVLGEFLGIYDFSLTVFFYVSNNISQLATEILPSIFVEAQLGSLAVENLLKLVNFQLIQVGYEGNVKVHKAVQASHQFFTPKLCFILLIQIQQFVYESIELLRNPDFDFYLFHVRYTKYILKIQPYLNISLRYIKDIVIGNARQIQDKSSPDRKQSSHDNTSRDCGSAQNQKGRHGPCEFNEHHNARREKRRVANLLTTDLKSSLIFESLGGLAS
jgi:hypothetical protein